MKVTSIMMNKIIGPNKGPNPGFDCQPGCIKKEDAVTHSRAISIKQVSQIPWLALMDC